MALIKNIVSESGVDTQYWKITKTNINWLTRESVIVLSGFVNKQTRQLFKTPIKSIEFVWKNEEFPFIPDSPSIETAYLKIKTFIEWYDAQDDLDNIPVEPEEPIIEEPVIEEPIIEEPIIEEPIIEEPVIEEPVIEEPIIEEPVIEEPIIEEPVIEEPIIEEPVIEEPIIEEPVIEEPSVPETPVVEEPSVPVVEEPVVEGISPGADSSDDTIWDNV